MDINPTALGVIDHEIYNLTDVELGVDKQRSDVWRALESLSSSDLSTRRAGLDALIVEDVAHRSPLVSYFLATRINDPDISLRIRVVKVLGDVLSPAPDGRTTPTAVRMHLASYLSQMRTQRILALLEVAESDPSTRDAIASLLKHCPRGGAHLAKIMKDRNISLKLRKYAVEFIADVGYLEVIATLERLSVRLGSRLNGNNLEDLTQDDGDVYLLPEILNTLEVLKSP